MVDFQILDWVQCPRCVKRSWRLTSGGVAEHGHTSPTSIFCAQCGNAYEIIDGILNLLPDGPHFLTPAQRTNFMLPVAWGYENLWRSRSLTLLSGHSFGFARELSKLCQWLQNERPGVYLDLACSHGLYARALAREAKQINLSRQFIALDSSMLMLKRAAQKIRAEKLDNVSLLCAEGERLPFSESSLDGVVCGGSLNEFLLPELVLDEATRVLKPGGAFFSMHLLRASSPPARFLQTLAMNSGINFFAASQVHGLFEDRGFHLVREEEFGIVSFTLYRKN